MSGKEIKNKVSEIVKEKPWTVLNMLYKLFMGVMVLLCFAGIKTIGAGAYTAGKGVIVDLPELKSDRDTCKLWHAQYLQEASVERGFRANQYQVNERVDTSLIGLNARFGKWEGLK